MTFDDLEFKPHRLGDFMQYAQCSFANGFGASVVSMDHIREGTYEIMIQTEDGRNSQPADDDWPKSGLTEDEITYWLQWIEALPRQQ